MFLIVTWRWGAALWLSAWGPLLVINLHVVLIAVRAKAGWDSDQVIFNTLLLLLSYYPSYFNEREKNKPPNQTGRIKVKIIDLSTVMAFHLL